MQNNTSNIWNSLYKDAEPIPPARVLIENRHLLANVMDSESRALDIACGLAENSFLLARQGYLVDAWDNASVAVERVNQKAKLEQLSVKAEVKDVINEDFPVEYYDVIILTHYLEQQISNKIIQALKPEGLLFFQTFTREKVSDNGPEDPKYRLKRNELLTLFSGLKIIVYREEGLLGDVKQGFRNEALLIGKKP